VKAGYSNEQAKARGLREEWNGGRIESERRNNGMLEWWKNAGRSRFRLWLNRAEEGRDQNLRATEGKDHGERRRHPPSLKLWRTGRNGGRIQSLKSLKPFKSFKERADGGTFRLRWIAGILACCFEVCLEKSFRPTLPR
jgi:hypothetical protein